MKQDNSNNGQSPQAINLGAVNQCLPPLKKPTLST